MNDFVGWILPALTLGLPIGAFYITRRRAGHTRLQLVGAATLGGGTAGALGAAFVAAGGVSSSAAFPIAFFGLVTGFSIGILGVVAFALGRWLNREP